MTLAPPKGLQWKLRRDNEIKESKSLQMVADDEEAQCELN